MATRADFGNSWREVVENWCAGFALPVEEQVAWNSLQTMEDLWPEYLDNVIAQGIRSRLVMADVVDYGGTLQACRDLDGFARVLQRLKAGDAGALAELKFGASLAAAGYLAVLEPELNGNRLDAVIEEGAERVFVEVISPELSQVMQRAEEVLGILAGVLSARTPGLITDVYLLSEPGQDSIRQILEFVLSAPQPSVVHEIPGLAFVAIRPFDPRIELTKSNFIDRGSPAIGIVSANREGHLPSLVMVRLPIDDQRAARLMAAEAHHFSRDETNILAIDVSNIPGSIRDWMPLIERRLQPNLNRRFGAVVLFTRVNQLHNANVVRGYRVLRNAHAHRPVPEAILAAISNLDETP
jgi:hypothetical protein